LEGAAGDNAAAAAGSSSLTLGKEQPLERQANIKAAPVGLSVKPTFTKFPSVVTDVVPLPGGLILATPGDQDAVPAVEQSDTADAEDDSLVVYVADGLASSPLAGAHGARLLISRCKQVGRRLRAACLSGGKFLWLLGDEGACVLDIEEVARAAHAAMQSRKRSALVGRVRPMAVVAGHFAGICYVGRGRTCLLESRGAVLRCWHGSVADGGAEATLEQPDLLCALGGTGTALTLASDGLVWAATTKGVRVVDPDEGHVAEEPPDSGLAAAGSLLRVTSMVSAPRVGQVWCLAAKDPVGAGGAGGADDDADEDEGNPHVFSAASHELSGRAFSPSVSFGQVGPCRAACSVGDVVFVARERPSGGSFVECFDERTLLPLAQSPSLIVPARITSMRLCWGRIVLCATDNSGIVRLC
jgi:hypothetical protein